MHIVWHTRKPKKDIKQHMHYFKFKWKRAGWIGRSSAASAIVSLSNQLALWHTHRRQMEHLSTPIFWNHFMLPHSCNLHSDDDTWRSMNTFLCKAVLKDGLLKEKYKNMIKGSHLLHFLLNTKVMLILRFCFLPPSTLSGWTARKILSGTIDTTQDALCLPSIHPPPRPLTAIQDRRDTFGSLLWFAKEQFSKLVFAPVSSSQLVINFI